MSTINNGRDLARLQAVLDAVGANPARWPAGEAEALRALTGSDPQASRMLAEAQALDRVLAAAPSGAAGRFEGLADRIMGQANGAGKALPNTADIVVLPKRARAAPGHFSGRPLKLWPMLGAMAAALVIGFYLGGSDLLAPAMQQVAGLSQDEADLVAPAAAEAGADTSQEGELL